MVNFLRRYYWLLVSPLYWYVAFWIVGYVSPIYVDGDGPMPTFYWCRSCRTFPAPTLREYNEQPNLKRALFFPYWIGAAIITLVGCGMPGSLRQFSWRRRSPFLVTFAATMLTLMGAAAVSDAGTRSRLWHGPTFYHPFTSVPALLKIIVPVSLFAGLLAMLQKWLEIWRIAAGRW